MFLLIFFTLLTTGSLPAEFGLMDLQETVLNHLKITSCELQLLDKFLKWCYWSLITVQ